MLAFLPCLCLIEVVNGVQKLTDNHTGTFKLSGSCWTIRRWFAEDASAVKMAAEMDVFRVSPQQMHIKLLGQGYVKERLKSSLRKFYGRYGDLTKQYGVPLSRMLHGILDVDHIQ